MLVLTLYNALFVPFRTAFMSVTSSPFLNSFEVVADALFFIDVIMTFFTSFERVDGVYEIKLAKIA